MGGRLRAVTGAEWLPRVHQSNATTPNYHHGRREWISGVCL